MYELHQTLYEQVNKKMLVTARQMFLLISVLKIKTSFSRAISFDVAHI
jgi:hypothetical protein